VRVLFSPFLALWRQRSLLLQFTLRNVELRHKGSHLGLVWSVLNPLLMLGLYVFVFGYVFGGSFREIPNETRLDYALAIFLGLTLFHLVAEILGNAAGIIAANPNFVKKVVFPLEVLPAAQVGASAFHMGISFSLVVLGIATVGPGLSLNSLWMPLIILPLVLLALGLAWFLAAAGVFFRDLGQIVGVLSIGIMFASAIFYPSSQIPPTAWAILKFNPILLAVELARDSLMWHHAINLNHLGYLWVIGIGGGVGGYWCFRRLAPAFADVL
jgi:lipopolysaccharide transport system permease protein